MKAPHPKQIAFWFRYGPAEHAELFHCLPEIIEGLARRNCIVHYYGLKSSNPVPERIALNAQLHILPIKINRTSNADKAFKTLLWIMLLPVLAILCRRRKIDAVYIDETLPLSTGLARFFFGRKVAVTITDFFLNIYGKQFPLLLPFIRLINGFDLRSWQKLPLIFTRAKSTRAYLIAHGVHANHIAPVYDPCDTTIYHPLDKDECKRKLGFSEKDMVLVHHGILHPNKGNDRIIKALPAVLEQRPDIRYLLIGDGPEMSRLRQLVKSKDLEKIVVFTGWLPKPADVNCALNAGDIGLVMRTGAETDHFAMTGTLIHNMACALPILAARLSSIKEVIADGQNGFLFNPTDMTEFKEKLLRLAADRNLRREFGQKGLNIVHEFFDMHKVAQQSIELLQQLCVNDF